MFTALDSGILLNLLLVIAGVVIGCVSTIVGLGGGFIIVPILLIFFRFSPQYAIGTSLMIIFFNSLSAAAAYMKQRRVDYKLGLVIAGFGIPGTIIGAYLSRFFSKETFSIFFGILLIIVSWYLLKGRCTIEDEEEKKVSKKGAGHKVIIKRDASFGFFMGLVSSVAGVGGGLVCMPFMLVALMIPVHIATATSMFIIVVISSSAFVTHLGLGHVNLIYGIPLGIGTIVGAQLGAHVSNRMSPRLIQNALAIILIVTALRLLIVSLYQIVV